MQTTFSHFPSETGNPFAYEEKRIAALNDYLVLDTPAEGEFDALTQLAAYICQTPMALITLIDSKRQWFKSKRGLDLNETPKEIAFCRFTILGNEIYEVTDALLHKEFHKNPLVVGPPHIRYYCGAPLITPSGFRLGSLAVLDQVPRALDDSQKRALQTLAQEVVARLELKRQKTQVELQKQKAEQNERLFKSLFEHSGGYLYTHDLSGKILSANPAAAQALQRDPASLTGKNIADFLILNNPDDFAAYLRRIESNKAANGMSLVRTATGEERYWVYRNFLYESPGTEPFVICSAHDVTDKELAQKILLQAKEDLETQVQIRTAELSTANTALQSTREELEVFLYRASHDLRGPVCSLKGIMQLTEREETVASRATLQTMMQQTMQKLENAMESLLQYTNNQHNYLQYEAIDFVSIIQDAISYCSRIKGYERVQINTNIQVSCPFYSDTDRIRIIIQHLLANSIAFQDLYIPDPFVRIMVTADAQKATISLEDNGVGVPPDSLPFIFNRFVKVSQQSVGSGLGLYIVKEVLHKLDGSIQVLPGSPKGSLFIVEIPNRKAEAE